MGFSVSASLSLLSDALRGVGAPFGGARYVEFSPALTGGHARAELLDTPEEILDALASKKAQATLAADEAVIMWHAPKSYGLSGVITAGELRTVAYEGTGTWTIGSRQRIRLLSDQHVRPKSRLKGLEAFLYCLQGDGIEDEANALVTMTPKQRFDAICELTTFVAPALSIAVEAPQHPSVKAYLEGPLARIPILTCRNIQTEEMLQFDLPTLLAVKDCGKGVFEIKGKRYGVIALRPVTPERVEHSIYGYTMPRMVFRPPMVPLH